MSTLNITVFDRCLVGVGSSSMVSPGISHFGNLKPPPLPEVAFFQVLFSCWPAFELDLDIASVKSAQKGRLPAGTEGLGLEPGGILPCLQAGCRICLPYRSAWTESLVLSLFTRDPTDLAEISTTSTSNFRDPDRLPTATFQRCVPQFRERHRTEELGMHICTSGVGV